MFGVIRKQFLFVSGSMGNITFESFCPRHWRRAVLENQALSLPRRSPWQPGYLCLACRFLNSSALFYWNGEDPAEETERRIAAILLHFRIDPGKIKGWLFVDSGRILPIRIAGIGKAGLVFTTDAEVLTKALIKLKADGFIADPFVKTHGVPENDNGAIDQIAARYARIADEADCAIELTHHVRKAGGLGRIDVTVNDGRGAVALKDAARDVRTLNIMAAEEATGAQVKPKDRRSYFRVDASLGKQNMAAPSESDDWYKIISVPLCNNPEFPGTDGDSVGVVVKWELPGVFATS